MPAPKPLAHCPPSQLAAIRAVATDIDDTLTTHGLLAAETLALVQRLVDAGVQVLLVTGRPAGHTMGLVTYLSGLELAIAENGGVLLTRSGAELLVDGTLDALSARLDACEREIADNVRDARRTGDRFARITDRTFHVEGMSAAGRAAVDAIAMAHGFETTASSIHVHVLLPGVSKGEALVRVCQRLKLDPARDVITAGDSLTDAPLFDPARFRLSVGVANVAPYLPRLPHAPAYICESREGGGFAELARALLAAKGAA